MIDSAIAWMEAHDKLSGWVQAIGVIVAIVAAYVIARVQGFEVVAEAMSGAHLQWLEGDKHRARLKAVWAEWFDTFDLLLCPVLHLNLSPMDQRLLHEFFP